MCKSNAQSCELAAAARTAKRSTEHYVDATRPCFRFCAGPNGCPPSNCLDSGSNELFVSHGRKKRSALAAADGYDEQTAAETLSAVIRVLADGETASDGDAFYKNATLAAPRYADACAPA